MKLTREKRTAQCGERAGDYPIHACIQYGIPESTVVKATSDLYLSM